jgi:hypothetical protein
LEDNIKMDLGGMKYGGVDRVETGGSNNVVLTESSKKESTY